MLKSSYLHILNSKLSKWQFLFYLNLPVRMPNTAYLFSCVTGELPITKCWPVRGSVGPGCHHLFLFLGDGDREDDLPGNRVRQWRRDIR